MEISNDIKKNTNNNLKEKQPNPEIPTVHIDIDRHNCFLGWPFFECEKYDWLKSGTLSYQHLICTLKFLSKIR